MEGATEFLVGVRPAECKSFLQTLGLWVALVAVTYLWLETMEANQTANHRLHLGRVE